MSDSKQDRELIELLNELRVALPGVQVLFAFLLIVPFSQGFARVTSTQKSVYFASFMCTAVATVFFIGPSAYHRIRWRARDKEHLLLASNRYAIVGLVFLALAVSCVVFFITDFLYPGYTGLATGAIAGLFAWIWFGLPIIRSLQDR